MNETNADGPTDGEQILWNQLAERDEVNAQLRAEVERLTKERDEANRRAQRMYDDGKNAIRPKLEQAERERDEARVRIGSPSGPTLEKYLKQNMSFGTIDFAIRSSLDGQNGNALLYIHPSGRDGDTLDFRVEGNSLYPL